MPLDRDLVLSLLAEFAEPATRAAAAAALARGLGWDALLLFALDSELGVALPAPGLPQTMHPAQPWRDFLDGCSADGASTSTIVRDDGQTLQVHGLHVHNVIAVAVGAGVDPVDLRALAPLLTMLGALFRKEQQVQAAEVQLHEAATGMQRASTMTQALQDMRVRLEEQAAALERLNVELTARTREAEAANRSKSAFLATMSHELRTPINAVLGYTELLSMGIGGDVTAQQGQQLDRIRASGRHLLAVINDVLDMAKIEAGHLPVVIRQEVVGDVIRDAMTLLQLQAEQRDITLESECGDPDTIYYGDENRVRQIVTNLMSNAVKFTAPGGRISVRCRSVDTAPPETGLTAAGPWTTIEVEDTGIGMNEAELRRIFKPFVQADSGHNRAHGGTGLGLTISRQLARLMGGELTARSTPGEGSVFTLWLPTRDGVRRDLDPTLRLGTAPGTATD